MRFKCCLPFRSSRSNFTLPTLPPVKNLTEDERNTRVPVQPIETTTPETTTQPESKALTQEIKPTPSTDESITNHRPGISGEATPSQWLPSDSGEPSSEEKSISITIPLHDKDLRSKEMIKGAILANEFLNKFEESQIEAVINAMYSQDHKENTFIITEGESGSHLYVSAEGKFEVLKQGQLLGGFGPGRIFGELAILYNCKRNASIKVVTSSKVWVLDRRVFQQIVISHGRRRVEDNVRFLQSVSPLKEVKREILLQMADLLQVKFFTSGTRIVEEGAKGDAFYIITGGSVQVMKRTSDGGEEEVGKLNRGDFFGEQALIHAIPRQASIVTLAPAVECLVLDREPFVRLLGNLPEIINASYPSINVPSTSTTAVDVKQEYLHISLEDLEVIQTLGVGGFGRVELVRYKKKEETFALKYMKKSYVVEQQQQEHVYNEKKVMLECAQCPFISRLFRTYRDKKYVYFLMEACLGGDLFTVLQKYHIFNEPTAKFMSACVIEALDYLHSRGFIYRDLKPENLLLDSHGYIKMIDFGFAKPVGTSGKTWTFAGTPEYIAPEVILNKGHDRAVDYWALGVFIFEMLTGRPPFRAPDHLKTYNLILKGIEAVKFPHNMSKSSQSLVLRLCRTVATDRLGYQKTGIQAIRNHKWFIDFNWDAVRQRTMTAPIIRPITGPTDCSNFDKYKKNTVVPPDETSGWDINF